MGEATVVTSRDNPKIQWIFESLRVPDADHHDWRKADVGQGHTRRMLVTIAVLSIWALVLGRVPFRPRSEAAASVTPVKKVAIADNAAPSLTDAAGTA
jgi:hypothetical protein